MSLLSQLAPKEGSTHYKKRLGRGRGSGLGQTSGKGHKGQLARTGGKVRRGFEGGQTPLMRRLPKFGFSNVKFQTPYDIINLRQLESFVGTEVNADTLGEAGLVRSSIVKILGDGKISKKLNVKVHKISTPARLAIESAGGSVEVLK